MAEIFQINNIPVIAYVDNDERKWGTIQNGIAILELDECKMI